MKARALAALLLLAGSTMSAGAASYDDLNAGISYFNQEQYDEAITWLDKAIAAGDLIPDLKHVAYLDRGMAHAAKGDAQKAIADYTAAIAIKPESILAYRQRAALYLALNDKEMARANYRLLLKFRPNDGSIWGVIGWLSWQMGDFQATAGAFASMANGDVHSWLWLQLANMRLGRPLSDYSDGISAGAWPAFLVRFYRGILTEADLLTAASDAEAGSLPGKTKYDHAVCDAHLYAGLWRVVHDDQAGAAPLLKTAVKKCAGTIAENIAQTELAKMAPGEKTK
jgi:tetratricopeptide (TPR) repeat protein